MLDLETDFSFFSISDISLYYFDERITEYDERVSYGNSGGNYTKLILISKVVTALFEVT